jgi:hypothetical protein
VCQESIAWSQPLSCGHCFHVECLTHSFIDKCPICRAPIKEIGILARQPPKEIKVEEPISSLLSIHDLSTSITELLVEGVQITSDIIVYLRPELLQSPDTQSSVTATILTIPAITASFRGNIMSKIIVDEIASIGNISMNDMLLFISYIYSRCNEALKRKFIMGVMNYIANFTNEDYLTHPTIQVYNDNFTTFEISKFPNGLIRLSAGDIIINRMNIPDIKILEISVDPSIRYKQIICSRGCLVDFRTSSLYESLEFIGMAIGADFKIVYMQPMTDVTTISILSDVIVCTLKHIIRYFTSTSIGNIIKKYETINTTAAITCTLIFSAAHQLVMGNTVNISNISNQLIYKFKNAEFLKCIYGDF